MAKHRHRENQENIVRPPTSQEALLEALIGGETTSPPEASPPDLHISVSPPSPETTVPEPIRPPKPPTRNEIAEGEQYAWEDFETAPIDGSYVYLSVDGRGEGELCYARRTRVAVGFRWEQARIWSSVKDHRRIEFAPKYWRRR